MPNISPDQPTFWLFLVPGFILVWSFRYFTNSDKKGDFEFLGLGIVCGFFNLYLYGFLTDMGIFKDLPLTNFGEMYGAASILVLLAFFVGLICAQVSKWSWFRKLIRMLQSNWFKDKS